MTNPQAEQSAEEPHVDQTDSYRAEANDPVVPGTGEPEVDRALESLQGLESAPLSDHHDRLARVHEELHSVLSADQSASDNSSDN